MTRSRNIKVAAACGGVECSGASQESKRCNPQGCPARARWGGGDPHMIEVGETNACALTNGSQHLSDIRSHGDYWILTNKNKSIQIQGRYGVFKVAAVEKIAIGGSFLGGHKLIIPPTGNDVTWDGEPILTDFPSSFKDGSFIEAEWHEEPEMVENRTLHAKGIDIQLPLGIQILVDRWSSHIDVLIHHNSSDIGIDKGHCSEGKQPSPVDPQDDLFEDSADNSTGSQVTLEDCATELREKADDQCEQDVRGRGEFAHDWKQICIFDICFAEQTSIGEEDASDMDATVRLMNISKDLVETESPAPKDGAMPLKAGRFAPDRCLEYDNTTDMHEVDIKKCTGATNQKWYETDGVLKNLQDTEKCLDYSPDTEKFHMFLCDPTGGSNQHIDITSSPTGGVKLVVTMTSGENKCMQHVDWSPAPQLAPCEAAKETQKWSFGSAR